MTSAFRMMSPVRAEIGPVRAGGATGQLPLTVAPRVRFAFTAFDPISEASATAGDSARLERVRGRPGPCESVRARSTRKAIRGGARAVCVEAVRAVTESIGGEPALLLSFPLAPPSRRASPISRHTTNSRRVLPISRTHSQQPVTLVGEEDGSGLETQCLGAVREFFEPGMRAQRIQPGMARESIVAAVSLVDCQGQQLQRTFGLVQSRQQARCTKKTLWIRGMKPQRLIECFQALSAIALQISPPHDGPGQQWFRAGFLQFSRLFDRLLLAAQSR